MTAPTHPYYRLVMAGPAARALAERLPRTTVDAVVAFITGPLLENPRRVGKPLGPPLAPAFSTRRGAYRVLYLIDDDELIVRVTAIRHRADAYHTP